MGGGCGENDRKKVPREKLLELRSEILSGRKKAGESSGETE